MKEKDNVCSPRVSVVVPVFNCEKYLERCLESLRVQTLQNIEIILVNNGSTDRSGDILRWYAEKDSRFVLFEQENMGIQGSRNRGLAEARGEYIGFVDADDFVEASMFSVLLEKAVATGSDISICDYVMTFRNHETESVLGLQDETVEVSDLGQDIFYLRYFGKNPEVWNKLYRRSMLTENGLQFEVGHGEDLLLHLRLLSYVKRLCVSHQPLYHYVQRHTSAAHGLTEAIDKDVNLLSRYLEGAKGEHTADQLSMLAFSNIFTGFMFSAYCIGKPISYFDEQLQALRGWASFEKFCYIISQTEELASLYLEQTMSKRFYLIQKFFFGLCLRGKDYVASLFLWGVSKLIVFKKRRFQIEQFE